MDEVELEVANWPRESWIHNERQRKQVNIVYLMTFVDMLLEAKLRSPLPLFREPTYLT